ncbi:MAG: CotH kinase family protein, partial [Lachnospiraceae bacterium]|nr:CotH kinase family protein [Lachnospiraceae bacterium]
MTVDGFAALDVRLAHLNDTGEAVRLSYDETLHRYEWFLPSEFLSLTPRVYFHGGGTLAIGENVYRSGDVFSAPAEETPVTATAYDARGNLLEEVTLFVMQARTLPSLYIDTVSGSMDDIHADKKHLERALFFMRDAEGAVHGQGQCVVNGRGNSSWGADQKPYRLTLDESRTFFGLPHGRTWALLSNYGGGDWQLRNRFALECAHRIGLSPSPGYLYINLYLNGVYNGTYLMTQEIAAQGEWFLEFDRRYENEPYYLICRNNVFVVKKPKTPDIDASLAFQEDLDAAMHALYDEAGEGYRAHFDLPSFLRSYWIQEFFVNWDYDFSSLYVYRNRGDRLFYAGPAWDFDKACYRLDYGRFPLTTAQAEWIRDTELKIQWHEGNFLSELGKKDDFRKELFAFYREEMSSAVEALLQEELPVWIESLKDSVAMEEERFNREKKELDQDAVVLTNWIHDRKSFWDGYCAAPEDYCTVRFDFEWGIVACHVRK